MPTLRVTLLTQQRRALFEQRGMDRAMWRMAQGTVFRGWGMLPQKWTTLFSMTAKTGLIESRFA